MSRLVYNASVLRPMAEQMKTFAKGKEMADEQTVSVSLVEQDEKTYMVFETRLPKYELCVHLNLLPEEAKKEGMSLNCDADNSLCVKTNAEQLLGALKSMNDSDATIELARSGRIEISGGEDARLQLEGVTCRTEGMPQQISDCVVIRDLNRFCAGLRAAVKFAGVRYNDSDLACIHLHLNSDALIIEGANRQAKAFYEARDIFAVAPRENIDFLASVDSGRRLLSLLSLCAEKGDKQVSVALTTDGRLVVQNSLFTMLLEKQAIDFPDWCEERDRTYDVVMPMDRLLLRKALGRLKALTERNVDITMWYDHLVLSGTNDALPDATVTAGILEGRLPQGISSGFTKALGAYPIDPIITALTTCYKEEEARVNLRTPQPPLGGDGYNQTDWSSQTQTPQPPLGGGGHNETGCQELCIDCGELRVVVTR